MKTWKKAGALVCSLAMVLALAACNGGGDKGADKGGDKADVAQILTDAEKKVSEAKSMQADMNMEMNMTMKMGDQTQEVKTVTTMGMMMMQSPVKMKMDMKMNIDMGAAAQQEINNQIYAIEKDGVYTMYTNDGNTWTSNVIDMGALDQYNPQASLGLYMNSATSFKADGEDTINGAKATKYTGVIGNDALNEVMQSAGLTENLQGVPGVEGIDIAALYKDMGDMPVSIWIDEAGYPVRYEMDMTSMMGKLYEKIFAQLGDQAGGMSMTCDLAKITMDCSNYDKVADFEVPAEAMQ